MNIDPFTLASSGNNTSLVNPMIQPMQSSIPTQEWVTPNVVQTTPVDQPITSNSNIICKLLPAEFDALRKILTILESDDIVTIVNSQICQQINNGTAILSTDITKILNNRNDINLHIIYPKSFVKHTRNIKGPNDVLIIDDSERQSYKVTNGAHHVHCPKQIKELAEDATVPDLTNIQVMGTMLKLNSEQFKQSKDAITDSEFIELLIHENQMKGVYVPRTTISSTYIFPDFVGTFNDEQQNNPQLKLKCFSLFPINGEEVQIFLGQLEDKYWMKTKINTGIIEVDIYENIQPATDENLLL